MSSFTRLLNYEFTDDPVPNQYGNTPIIRTLESFRFYYDGSMTGWYFEAPNHSIANGGSIPDVLQNMFGLDPFDPWYLQGYVMHDLMVGECGKMYPIRHDDGRFKYISWGEAADWLNKAMVVKESCVPKPITKLQRKMIILFVRGYGLVRPKVNPVRVP